MMRLRVLPMMPMTLFFLHRTTTDGAGILFFASIVRVILEQLDDIASYLYADLFAYGHYLIGIPFTHFYCSQSIQCFVYKITCIHTV